MILFEWDEAKAESNLRKHGITFRDGEDWSLMIPCALMEQDRIVGGERAMANDRTRRWHRQFCLSPTRVEEEGEHEMVRIISARRATRQERKRYEENRKKYIG